MNDLAKLRALSGLTQFSAAHRSGLSRMRLSLAENKEIELRSEEEAKLRSVLTSAINERAVQIRAVLENVESTPAHA